MSKCLIILAFCLSVGARCEALSASELQQELQRYQNLKSLKASFEQVKHLKGMSLALKSSGIFSLLTTNDGKEATWQILKPVKTAVLLKKDSVTIRSEDHEQSFSLKAVPGAQRGLAELLAWMNLDAAKIAETYEVKRTGEGHFLCVPKKPSDSAFAQLEMTLKKGFLQKLILFEKSGDRMELEFGGPSLKSSADHG